MNAFVVNGVQNTKGLPPRGPCSTFKEFVQGLMRSSYRERCDAIGMATSTSSRETESVVMALQLLKPFLSKSSPRLQLSTSS
eukprot:CAMPEP_0117601752 /NCGR_PEP_ID=MMETSP0784-20121206/77205_1 /TAXON_ID=39447 /ORGANISM="" /LENGTH=81 /DNA_ID=CAMNT_0005404505 /DNA_START=310 /DNA_END=555 /DNA_ORIENTATION=-